MPDTPANITGIQTATLFEKPVASFSRFWEDAAPFQQLQQDFAGSYEQVFPDREAAKAVVIIPSLTLDQDILSRISGISHYEERLLCLLLLLRMPRTHVIYVTSMPIDPVVIDYYLHLLPGITNYHARKRLTLLSCYDLSARSLTEKILERPLLLERIRTAIPPGHPAHIACFNVTEWERHLAVQLQLPIYGCDPLLYPLGTKSNSRRIFRECGLQIPDGYEDLHTIHDLAKALFLLRQQQPQLRKAVVKMNDGFSGEGNAIYTFNEQDCSVDSIIESIPQQLFPVAPDHNTTSFLEQFMEMGGVAEAFIEGEIKTSPSAQCRINPLGVCEIISTHDQVLKGPDGQVFTGACFPADPEYAATLAAQSMEVTRWLQQKGVIGRFGIDFVSVKEGYHWKHYAIEINLRKGGTTHPFIMLQYLTGGHYDAHQGTYFTANGLKRYYYASDNFEDASFRGLTPQDLIEITTCNNLLYDGTRQEGVMFHMISALSQYGKAGVVCIGSTPERAMAFYEEAFRIMSRAAMRPGNAF